MKEFFEGICGVFSNGGFLLTVFLTSVTIVGSIAIKSCERISDKFDERCFAQCAAAKSTVLESASAQGGRCKCEQPLIKCEPISRKDTEK